MGDNEKERKELMEAIRLVLLSTEECKTAITPLVRDQKDVFKILKSHEEAITLLMGKLLGTKEDHKKQSDTLELMKTSISEIEEEREIHKFRHERLEKRLKIIESSQVNQIIERVSENTVKVSDLQTVEKLLLLHPDAENLLALKSDILVGLDRKKEALEVLEKAVSKHPESAWLWYERGVLLEDFDEELKCFDRSLELIKDDPLLVHLVSFARAAIFANAERFEEALDSSIKSVEANPNCASGWCQKGMILVELRRIPEALGCFEKAIALEKDFKEAWLGKGNALSVLGPDHYDDAIVCYDTALKLDPKSEIVYFNKGKLLGMQGHLEQSLHNIGKGLEIDDNNPCGWCLRGICLNRMNRNKEALKSFRKTLELSPPKECYLVSVNVSVVLHTLKRDKEAVEMFDNIAIEPENVERLLPEMLCLYAELLYLNQRYKEGAEFGEKIVEAEPENVKFWDIFACNLQALGKDEEALEAFEKALSLKESDEEITWDALAKLYEKMGRKKEAEQAYEKLKALEEAKGANDVKQ